MRRSSAAWSLLLACALLAGCATRPPSIPALKAREVAKTFSVNGRIAARDTGDSKRGFSGGFSWDHRNGEDVVELLTPLGQIAARVTMRASGTTSIDLADGQRATTQEPEQYLSRALGINLPISALPYWMQAAPVPSLPVRAEADAIGRPAALWQSGWQIRYGEYADETLAAHPTRIDLVQGDVEAKMIISEWKTP